MVSEYRVYAQRVLGDSARGLSRTANSWSPPASGAIKINTDAYVPGNGVVGLGAVARDENGCIRWIGSRSVRARWDVGVAEAQAAIFGLEIAQEKGETAPMLECDALSLINALKGGASFRSAVGICVDDINYLRNCFPNSSVSHVKRGGNAVAHLVARLCETVGDTIVMVSDFPHAISAIAELDLI
ncbi:uncharacterized protein LOC141597492 [Silene latifolia]|uniref:uncharacterized protein LOC141597492 n=1 Tax=Silene latifolia TaxID=37657 RepID=UPI003D77650F